MRFAPKMYDEEGREIPGSRGYRYFGRARELPGVKELFERPVEEKEKKKVEEVKGVLDAKYFGFLGNEDDELLEYERKKEEEARKTVLAHGGGEPREGWTSIPGGWTVPGREEVTEYLLERRRGRLLAKLG